MQKGIETGAETLSAEQQALQEAVRVIDGALAAMINRDLVATGEVADLMLDLRTLLTGDSTQRP